jgi:hypothetical protein
MSLYVELMDNNYNTLCSSEMPLDIGYAQVIYYITNDQQGTLYH